MQKETQMWSSFIGPDGHLIRSTGHFSVMRKWGKKDECQGVIICY